jgi:hypothetical protein
MDEQREPASQTDLDRHASLLRQVRFHAQLLELSGVFFGRVPVVCRRAT